MRGKLIVVHRAKATGTLRKPKTVRGFPDCALS
jgi:hypothetical protein